MLKTLSDFKKVIELLIALNKIVQMVNILNFLILSEILDLHLLYVYNNGIFKFFFK